MFVLETLWMATCLLGAASATPNLWTQLRGGNDLKDPMLPSEWLPLHELESLPAVKDVTIEQLEKMSIVEGATLLDRLFHLARINGNKMTPDFAPIAEDIPVFIIESNGNNITVSLDTFVETVKTRRHFGDEEVTIILTGMPPKCETITKPIDELVKAYLMRYSVKSAKSSLIEDGKKLKLLKSDPKTKRRALLLRTQTEESKESDEDLNGGGINNEKKSLVIIDLGAKLNDFEQLFRLDVERVGDLIGQMLMRLTNEVNVPHDIVHIVAQGVAAHVAGAAGREFTRLTGHKLRRITALDPTKIFMQLPNVVNGLGRGDADFIDAIHTSALGMGTVMRVGDVDFYPNGPSMTVPGADNVIEASMRATRYFAETIIPGMEHSFPAIAATSLEELKSTETLLVQPRRAFMGIATEFDVKGDFVLLVNAQSPFGRPTATTTATATMLKAPLISRSAAIIDWQKLETHNHSYDEVMQMRVMNESTLESEEKNLTI